MSSPENVKVCVNEEIATISLRHPNRREDEPSKSFTFDYTFGFESKQLDIYNKVARPVVEQIFGGYNGTILAYGQTGTGKTFTMEGVRAAPELRGIIPNSFAHIFGHIAKADSKTTFLVHISYLEVYNEEIRDLLVGNKKKRLEIKERPDCGVYVRDLSSVMVQSPNEMERLMNLGSRNRCTAATNMNEHSSRSHAIFSITVECSKLLGEEKRILRQGKLHLVDLAGSERQSKTGAEGQRLYESNKINLSLATLGNVISALADGKSTHVPYRNSKLTRLLQDSLGGNSKTVMIANIGPTDYNYDESVSTLRYASRAKLIKNAARVNEDPKDALIRQFQKEIEELRAQLNDDIACAEMDAAEVPCEPLNDGAGLKNKSGKKLSREQMLEIESMINADRRKLEEQKDMAVEQRDGIKKRLGEKEEELACARRAQAELRARMRELERRLIVGGQNLLEKAEAQARLLERSAEELRAQEERTQDLRKKLREKKEERFNIEEKYNSLQDEAAGKRRKLQKLTTLYIQAKAELEDLRSANTREMDDLSESIRQLNQELQLQTLIINYFIPKNFQNIIERNVQWSDAVGEWQLRCIAYAGNNMNRSKEKKADLAGDDNASRIYLNYNATDGEKKAVSKEKKKRGTTNYISRNSSILMY
ncbi:Kinesin-like protein KIF3A [Taenia crassiceps]|uniref:Kinesin-like protein n=1 Tax=Taenia crassiceps TaxID=6207 RepID=A0ABR4QJC1_9CEST